MESGKKGLLWFRRDLRCQDNYALIKAIQECKNGVDAIFFITPGQWKEHNEAPAKVYFWLENLKQLRKDLAKLNIILDVEIADNFSDIPALLEARIQRNKIDALYFNEEYEVNEKVRDTAIIQKFASEISVRRLRDRTVLGPRSLFTASGNHYTVFTPFKKKWLEQFELEMVEAYSPAPAITSTGLKPNPIPETIDGFDKSAYSKSLWPAGEKYALDQLHSFIKNPGANYENDRDFPSIAGTSKLSPYLAAGVISVQTCIRKVLEHSKTTIDKLPPGLSSWVSELIWREFYTQILINFPKVCMDQPFKDKTKDLAWRYDEKQLNAWKTGQTGYPIVDAAMRQLNETGWMHNRLRMVSAMFLSKILLLDWRLGEKYFMETLIDGDLAANNGGWQWSASTGTDSVPYFRIFNPFSQSKRFDKDAIFIKKYCPELAKLDSAALHDPIKLAKAIKGTNYPEPIEDYKTGRERALKAFKSLG